MAINVLSMLSLYMESICTQMALASLLLMKEKSDIYDKCKLVYLFCENGKAKRNFEKMPSTGGSQIQSHKVNERSQPKTRSWYKRKQEKKTV